MTYAHIVGYRRLEDLLETTYHGQDVFVLPLMVERSTITHVNFFVTVQIIARFADGADEVRYCQIKCGQMLRSGIRSAVADAERHELARVNSAASVIRAYIEGMKLNDLPRQLKVHEATVSVPKGTDLIMGEANFLEFVEAEGVYRLREEIAPQT